MDSAMHRDAPIQGKLKVLVNQLFLPDVPNKCSVYPRSAACTGPGVQPSGLGSSITLISLVWGKGVRGEKGCGARGRLRSPQ